MERFWLILWHHMILCVGKLHLKSKQCQTWSFWVLWKWGYSIFILSRDITLTNDRTYMRPGEKGPLNLNQHSAKFDAYNSSRSGDMKLIFYMSCKNGDITFSFCTTTSDTYMIIGTCYLVGEPLNLSYHCANFYGNRCYGSGDMFLFCDVTSLNHMIKRTQNLAKGRHST